MGRVRAERRSEYALVRGSGSLRLPAALALLHSTAARAQDRTAGNAVDFYLTAFSLFERHEVASLALTLGAIAFAVLTGIMLVRARARAAEDEHAARDQIAELRGRLDRAIAIFAAEPQVIVTWQGAEDRPQVFGDPGNVAASPEQILHFASWLPPDAARRMSEAVSALRSRGEGFSMLLTTTDGRFVEAHGRAIAGRATLRLEEVSGTKRQLAELHAEHQTLMADIDPVRTLLETVPSPIWARDSASALVWVNPAYARAVDATSATDAVERQLEFLDVAAREGLHQARAAQQPYGMRMAVVVAGHRRVLDAFEVPARSGSAGIAVDVTEAEAMRAELARMVEAHRRTLDQLPTAVAIFTAEKTLTFCNTAYRELWDFDAGFLETRPSDGAILDKLRAARKLPEQTDFRQWRDQLHGAYRAVEAREHWWHLPDGRTLRVVASPNPDGGVTYVFDDVTERLQLERRYDALIRVQGETLDHLAEGVAVFGSDGRLRLWNPAFTRMWRLSPAPLTERPHIEAVIAWCRPIHRDDELWNRLRAAATGLDTRNPVSGRLERNDGSVVDCATVPLPDGGTLITFQEVTDSVNIERALRERNDALEMADELKNDFVHHVSYELRTPLTNIIGFAHLLHDTSTGPLTDKQLEYLGYISSSSTALLAIINDILDLASIDAGAMRLDLGPVDIRRAIDGAAEGVRDRLTDGNLTLDISVPENVGAFTADERRIRQILFNLLSNAIAFSLPGGLITLAAERRPDAVVFAVSDNGRGIPGEFVERVFNRFETHALGSQHRGAGLGLSIVRSFVELHGGEVHLESAEGQGTTVFCIFPLEQTTRRVAAE